MCCYILTLFDFALYQDCVWYGVCNKTKLHNQYCSYNGPAKRMPEDGIKLLQKQCGFMLENGQRDFCCDAEQVVLVHIFFNSRHIHIFMNANFVIGQCINQQI